MEYQDHQLLWELKFPTGQVHTVNLVFPLALFIVDIKGAHTICGMFDSYSNIRRPCVSCNCSSDNLDNPNTKCEEILDLKMKQMIKDQSEIELKAYSQHKLTENAFFKVNTGGWKYGIWGLCPAEILHQFYEGILSYTLDFFFDRVLSGRSRHNLNIGVQNVIDECKNQSDRAFPIATYTMGITHTSKMKGTEKFASVFFLSLYFYTHQSKNLFDGCNGPTPNLRNWRKLFKIILFYRDWLMKEEFSRSELAEKKVLIIEMFRLFKSLVKRTEGTGLKLPKFHELLHCCRDILRHGPARGFDTCPTESNHKPLKDLSQNTQRIKSRFESQTAKRLYEDNVIATAWNDSNTTSIEVIKKSKVNDTNNDNPIAVKSSRQGKYFIERRFTQSNQNQRYGDICNFSILFREKPLTGKVIGNHMVFSEELKSFLQQEIISHIDDNIQSIKCFSTYKRDGIIFYGYPRELTTGRSNTSWARFKWQLKNNETSYVPGKCLLFIDLQGVTYKSTSPKYADELHVVIQSLEKDPTSHMDSVKQEIASKAKLFKNPEFYCVSVNTIYDSSFVIPDIGNRENDQFLYVHSREHWKTKFV